MTASITPGQRYTRAHPCPICGGIQDSKSPHCHGWLSEDGEWAHCDKDRGDGAMLIERGIRPVYKHRREEHGSGYRAWTDPPPKDFQKYSRPHLSRDFPRKP